MPKYFEKLRGELSRSKEEEVISYFHIPLFGGKFPSGSQVLERQPEFTYQFNGRNEIDWEKETRDFIRMENSAGNQSFENWRRLIEDDKSSIDNFQALLLKFSERGYIHIRKKKISELLKTNNSPQHNDFVLNEMYRLSFSPMCVEQVGAVHNVFVHKYWVSSEPQEYERGEIFSQITNVDVAIASEYSGYFRATTLLNFLLLTVTFFRQCKHVYIQLTEEEKKSLHIEDLEKKIIYDPVDDIPEMPSKEQPETEDLIV